MARRCNSYNKQISLLILALQLILHHDVTLSYDNPFWCRKLENESTDVWIGHNFSKRVYLKDPILYGQTVVWTKGNSTWVKKNANPLEYNGDGNYSQSYTRYRITKVSNVSFDLFIDYADQNDTGHHVVTVNIGKQSLCTALMMNLTVNTPEPICSSRLSKSDGKLQMSCQWVQMNKGDRAHFEVESEILYEHQVQEANFKGTSNMTHTFSVNLGLDRLVDEVKVPPRCVISHKRGRNREMCEFLEVRSYPRNTPNKTVRYECCVSKPSKPLPLIYDCYAEELHISSTQNYTTNENKCVIFFLCCAYDDHNSNITVIKIEQIDMRRLVKYESSTLSVGEPENDNEHDNASEDQRCEVMTVKVTSHNWTLNNQDDTYTDCKVSKKCVSSHPAELVSGTTPAYNPGSFTKKYRHILMAVAATAASVLVFITGACITKCYYLYNSSGKHYLVRRDTAGYPQRSPSEAEDDAVVRDIALTTFKPETPKQEGDAEYQRLAFSKVSADAGYQSLNFNQPPSDEEVHCFKQESSGPCPCPPTLPLRRKMIEPDCGGRPESVKKNNGQQNLPTAGKPMPDSTYCSVDDVKDMLSKAENHELYGKNQLHPSSSGQKAVRADWKGTSSPTQELHEVFGKRNISHECFQSILLHEIFLPPPALTTNQAYHVYENAVASDADESTSGGELYINTPDPALI